MDNGIVESYAPLVDVKGSYVAQFEHVGLPLTQYFSETDSDYRRFSFTRVVKK
jgi:hypothetical protein